MLATARNADDPSYAAPYEPGADRATLGRHLNWSRGASPDDHPCEHGTAVADVLTGWTHPIAAIGLLLNAKWVYKFTWVTGSILLYHSFNPWFWKADRRAAGHGIQSEDLRLLSAVTSSRDC